MPEEAIEVVDWFESNYVLGRIRRHLRNGVAVRSPVLFPPRLWSVYDCMHNGFPRTQNSVEAWHRRWENLIVMSAGKAVLSNQVGLLFIY